MAWHDQQICSAEPCDVAALEELKQTDHDSCMVIINRFNFGPADVVGGSPLIDSAHQHYIVATLDAKETDTATASSALELLDIELSERQRQTALAIVLAFTPWASNTTIRSTPRRSGAPSSALC
ncbi:MAG: hypothetical protein WCK63_10195 [Betaproteobacteria bacterium]